MANLSDFEKSVIAKLEGAIAGLDADTKEGVISMLRIDQYNIDVEMEEHPSRFARWAVVSEIAYAKAKEADNRLKIVESEQMVAIQEYVLDQGGKISLDLLKARARASDEYRGAVAIARKTQEQSGILWAIKDAFVHRKDMLVNLSANKRKEFDDSGASYEEQQRIREERAKKKAEAADNEMLERRKKKKKKPVSQ